MSSEDLNTGREKARATCERLICTLEKASRLQRPQPGDRVRVPLLPYALAQLRQRIRPALVGLAGRSAARPIQIVPLGGTNSGKSTVINVLLGSAAAGMSAMARYSQHPVAFGEPRGVEIELEGRLEGYARYIGSMPPRQPDAELRELGYRPALAILDPERAALRLGPPAVPGALVWDAPDFSTEEAQIYLQAVVDPLGLADLVLFVVTDQSYADDRAQRLLRMVRSAGTRVLAVVNKAPEDASLLADIAEKLELGPEELLWLPEARGATPESRLVALFSTPAAARLRESVASLAGARHAEALRREALGGALGFLERRLGELLQPLRSEAEAARRWSELVRQATANELLGRYEREYLQSAHWGEFDQALGRLLQLLRVPGVSAALDVTKSAVGLPLRLARNAWNSWRSEPEAASGKKQPPEGEKLAELIEDWLRRLKAEAQALAETFGHAAWPRLVERLSSPEFRNPLLLRFAKAYKSDYQAWLASEVAELAHGIYRELEAQPALLNGLRAANLVVNAAAVGLAIKSGGIDWSDAIVAPIVSGLAQRLTEAGLGGLLELQRARLRRRQREAMERLLFEQLAAPAEALFPSQASLDELEAAAHDLRFLRSMLSENRSSS